MQALAGRNIARTEWLDRSTRDDRHDSLRDFRLRRGCACIAAEYDHRDDACDEHDRDDGERSAAWQGSAAHGRSRLFLRFDPFIQSTRHVLRAVEAMRAV